MKKLQKISMEKDTINKENFLKLLEPAKCVLDIGCNDGSFSKRIAEVTGGGGYIRN